MTSLTFTATAFIESVLKLNPRVAAFDCDGTLWSGDAGEGFFYWELERNLVSEEVSRSIRARHSDYKEGNVPEDVMCGEMVTMHHGLKEDLVQRATDEYYPHAIAPTVFSDMRELVRRLLDSGCDLWAVSSSNQWVIRTAMRDFGIRQDRILATEVAVENGVITDHLVRIPSGSGKPEALREVLDGPLDCAFGNSVWDREMLAMAKHPFAINPSAQLKKIAGANQWPMYQPDGTHSAR